MKLVSCYVSSFGNLIDFKYDFLPDYNVINKENGWGKSTLATFIKCMFYGLKNSQHKKVEVNERVKYRNWSSNKPFGGNVVFEKDGKIFRIERIFGKTEKEDSIQLFDVESGKSVYCNNDVGEKLFGINEDGFSATVFFSEKDLSSPDSSAILQKLNGGESQDAEVYKKAIKSIEDKLKSIKGRANSGSYYDTKNSIFQLNKNITEIKESEQKIALLKDNITQLEEKENNIEKEIENLNNTLSEFGKADAIKFKKERYSIAKAQYDTSIKRYKEINLQLNGKNISENDVNNHQRVYTDYIQAKAQERALSSIKKNKTSPLSVFCFLLTGIFILTGIVTLLFEFSFFYIIILVGALFFLVGIASLISNRKSNDSKLLEETRKDIKKQEDVLISFFNDFGMSFDRDIQSKFNYILSIIKERDFLKNTINEQTKVLENYSNDIDGLTSADNIDNKENLLYQLRIVQDESRRTINELSDKKHLLKLLEDDYEKIFSFKNTLSVLKNRLNQLEEEYDLLVKTAEFLKQADLNMKVKFRKPLEENINKYLTFLLGFSYDKARIDTDLNVSIDESGFLKDKGYYSSGYRSLFEICKKLALNEVLYTDEKPFIIFDDPFVNLDEDKISQALNLLNNLSKNYQVIYFVCHGSRT